jgi:hypothetical protein
MWRLCGDNESGTIKEFRMALMTALATCTVMITKLERSCLDWEQYRESLCAFVIAHTDILSSQRGV